MDNETIHFNGQLILRSEFAHVRIELDAGGRGPRLKITDLRTQQYGHLDPLELETLAWVKHGDLLGLLDPSCRRWNEGMD